MSIESSAPLLDGILRAGNNRVIDLLDLALDVSAKSFPTDDRFHLRTLFFVFYF